MCAKDSLSLLDAMQSNATPRRGLDCSRDASTCSLRNYTLSACSFSKTRSIDVCGRHSRDRPA